LKRLALATAALVAAVAVLLALTLPPARRILPPAAPDGTVAGVLHVHTTRSDGRGTPDAVAAAAARAGLRFVVFADHGNATRAPDPPVYRSGVLCIDAVEISTTGGHYLAIGLPGPAPYPLSGEPRDVVEDVRRLGGFGIAAHPNSPKPELHWSDWHAGVDGLEILNLDTAWRARAQWPGWRARFGLAAALLDYALRPAETIARLLPGTTAVYEWAPIAKRRRVVLTAGADAHGGLALSGSDPGSGGWSIPLPGYEASFRAMSVHIRPDRPLAGNAAADAAVLLRGLRAGHLYVAVDGLATPPSFVLDATNQLGTVHAGDTLGLGGPVTLRVRSNAPAGFTTIVWDGTREVARRDSNDFTVTAGDGPAVYWVEIRAADRSAPGLWLISNPVYVRAPEMPAAVVPPPATARTPIFDGTTAGWSIEHDPQSLAAVDVGPLVGGGSELRMRFGLGGAPPVAQYAALVRDMPGGVAGDRLTFTARADQPMRVSVQVRAAKPGGGEARWQRSVYLDRFDQAHTVFFDDMRPIAGTATGAPPLDQIRGILFVVDLTNTPAGRSGRIWIKAPEIER
jgi:hypothetical protein